ncbi:hypothetical protein NP493_1225g02033 [Ridgeia piscesae]|uniref:Uncharacterized protein n=1 Tax=Ridgeia piscesae TaxID=27915 RepID=A0AAD9KC60_RIDPI|nr:hypothetical protein NP493_1225g02033 [Ridgeia piscesae]
MLKSSVPFAVAFSFCTS